jgi:hypothetical protein
MGTRRNPDSVAMGYGGVSFIGQIYLTPAENDSLRALEKKYHCSKSLLIGAAFVCALNGIPLTEEFVIARSNRGDDYLNKYGDVKGQPRRRDQYANKAQGVKNV